MEVTLLVTSDIHGYIRGTNELTGEATADGFARVATYIKKRKKIDPNLILIENGDFLEGSMLANTLATHQDKWSIHPFIQLVNQLNYDSAVPGNHEFNYGINYLKKALKGLNAPYLAANIVLENGETCWEAYQIVERKGIRIAIVGLVTSYVTRWEKVENINGLRFLDPILTAKKWVPFIQETEQPDLIVLAYHGGLERDLVTGEATEYMTGENVGYRLATEIPGINGVITGHQHRTLAGAVNGVPLLQPGTRGASIGEMSFELQQKEQKWHVKSAKAQTISLASEKEDTAVLKEIEEWEHLSANDRKKPIIKGLDSVEPDAYQFLHKVQKVASRRKISVVSLVKSSVGSTALTMEMILENYTFPCTFAILRFTGQELKHLLIKGRDYYQLNQAGRLSPYKLGRDEQTENELIDGLTYRFYFDSKSDSYLVELVDVADDELIELSFNHYLGALNGERVIGMEKIIQEIMIYMPDLIREYQLEECVAIPVHGQGFYPEIS